jgi:hypothetical protein
MATAPALLAQNAIPAAHSAALVKRLPAAAAAAPDGDAEAPHTPEGSDCDEEVGREAQVGALSAAAAEGLAACKL